MNTKKTTRVAAPGLLITAGALAALAVAGCSGAGGSAAAGPAGNPHGVAPVGQTHSTATQQNSSENMTSDQVHPTAPSTHSSVNNQGHRPALTPECKANSLTLSFGGGDAGMSQQERVLRFTNSGSQACVIVGFPGVSYVTGDDGHQVGAAATRDGGKRPQITLQPGAVASTVIHSVDPGVFDPAACRETPVRGYRVYAPDDTAAMFIPLPTGTTGCAGTTPDPQLGVYSIQPGAGNPDQP
jgi:hypothetical protein